MNLEILTLVRADHVRLEPIYLKLPEQVKLFWNHPQMDGCQGLEEGRRGKQAVTSHGRRVSCWRGGHVLESDRRDGCATVFTSE